MTILDSFTYCCRPSTEKFENDSEIIWATFFGQANVMSYCADLEVDMGLFFHGKG